MMGKNAWPYANWQIFLHWIGTKKIKVSQKRKRAWYPHNEWNKTEMKHLILPGPKAHKHLPKLYIIVYNYCISIWPTSYYSIVPRHFGHMGIFDAKVFFWGMPWGMPNDSPIFSERGTLPLQHQLLGDPRCYLKRLNGGGCVVLHVIPNVRSS